MMAFFVFVALPAAAAQLATDQLADCVRQSNTACVAKLLPEFPSKASPGFWAVAARGYVLLGDRPAALRAVKNALEGNPKDFDLLMEQGWIQQLSGDQLAAIQSFLLAAQVRKSAPLVFYRLGMSFFLLHEFARAEKHFQHVLELDAKDDKAEFMLGVLDVLRSDTELAKTHFERALALQPDNPHYLLHYGVLLSRAGNPESSLEPMRRAASLAPANPLTHFNLGRIYRQRGDLGQAEREFRLAIRLRPNLASAHYALATILKAQGRTREAEITLKRFASYKADPPAMDPLDAALGID